MNKAVLIFSAIFLISLASCTQKKEAVKIQSELSGGFLRINQSQKLKTMWPCDATDAVSSNIISQVFEGLVRYDAATLEIVPAIAESWEIDKTGTIYTFYLRPDVYFHDDPCFKGGKGRPVTAEDFKFSFEIFSVADESNKRFDGVFDKISGAKEFREASQSENQISEITGITILEDTVLQIVFEKPSSVSYLFLLADVAASVIPEEGYENYGKNNHIGTGPFYLKEKPDFENSIMLYKNSVYYREDSLGKAMPYLDSVKVSFEPSTQKELKLLRDGELDIVIGLTDQYLSFVQENIDVFQSDPPALIVDASKEFTDYEIFNIRSSRVQNFLPNRLNIINLSDVYLKTPQPLAATDQ